MIPETTPSFDDPSPVADIFEHDAELIELSPGEIGQIHTVLGDHDAVLPYIARGLSDLVQLGPCKTQFIGVAFSREPSEQ